MDRRTTFSTFADTRAYDEDSVQEQQTTSNRQRVSPTNYEPNNFVNNDKDAQGNPVRRKSVNFDENVRNDESRI